MAKFLISYTHSEKKKQESFRKGNLSGAAAHQVDFIKHTCKTEGDTQSCC